MWQLLVDAEGIKVGDKIAVECDDGSTEIMKLIRYTDKIVCLRNASKEIVRFYAENLESKDGYLLIMGKV